MKWQLLIFIPTFLFSTFSFASLHGDWLGWGTWKYQGQSPGMKCQSMSMTWSESKQHISLDQGKYDCEFFVMYLGKTEWRIENEKLYDERNQEVGRYDGSNFEVYMPATEGETTAIHIQIKRVANHVDIQEIWYNAEEKIYVIQGRLFTGG